MPLENLEFEEVYAEDGPRKQKGNLYIPIKKLLDLARTLKRNVTPVN